MSFRQPKWARWLVDRSQESWKLLAQGVRAPQQFRQTLVQQAQQEQNRTALTLLRTHKEWNDMRYYGFVEYLRQKMPSPVGMLGLQYQQSALANSPFRSTSTDAAASMSSSSSSPPAPGTTTTTTATTTMTTTPAKVAFMVTGRMKGQLSELGYATEEIKALTPVEASLLIEHGVEPHEKPQQLPRLVQAYEQQQQQQQAQAQAEAATAANAATTTEQQSEMSTANQTEGTATTDNASPPPSSHGPRSFTERLLGSKIASENVINKPTDISSRLHMPTFSLARTWYEVVEEYGSNDNSSGHHHAPPEVVALHSTPEEAQLDANLRFEIMTKRAQEEKKNVNVQYTIRKTVR